MFIWTLSSVISRYRVSRSRNGIRDEGKSLRCYFFALAQASFSPTVRLKINCSFVESLSRL